ncbi:hypothetical protein EA58_11375 [Photobacterium galatheae]|uniref:Polymer-forming cytoskeletal family protein n=1 Tax=Photobacterium galatheae TaxID=1654360 RepID=A0A066RR79_9GAMM|nr:hypothetical protein EA58_11375 [Photobacterium galatheae]
MQVDGYIEGRIRTEQTLSISATGRVSGEIYANKVVINGLHEGACHAASIEILEKGKAKGVIYTNDICIERGGCFLGQTHPADDEKVVTLNKEEAKTSSESKSNPKDAASLTPPTQLKPAEVGSSDKNSTAASASAGKPGASPTPTATASDNKKQANARK